MTTLTAELGVEQALREIVERSSTVDERLGADFEAFAEDGPATDRRLAAWCDAIAKGSWERFTLRLAWDGLDLADARRAVGRVRLREGVPEAPWVDLLREVLGESGHLEPGEADGFLATDEPLPFEDLLGRFVRVARRRLDVVGPQGRLAPDARWALERGLLMSLVTASADALQGEFASMRTRTQSSWGRLVSLAGDPDAHTLYTRFVDGLSGEGLVALFRTYPVLGRRLGEICHLWVEATDELERRLDADFADLEETFGPLGTAVSASPSLSDAHNGRRRVVALEFASGRNLVYKPKDLGTEAEYQRLLRWLNEHGAPLDFRVLRVLDRSTHGWVEFVEHTSVESEAGAGRYYERAGMLLCLVYALEGTDCHYENILANGEFPVLVDAETLMHHRAREVVPEDGRQAQALANEQLDYSVLRTGMLPRWQVSADGRTAYDVSGLGETVGQELPYEGPRWTHVNTDRMAVELVRITIPTQTNVPQLDGRPLSLRDHGRQVVDGFERMYRFLVDRRDALLASDPVRALSAKRVRFVYRPTKVYALIVNNLQSAERLHDGADQSIHVEQLGRAQIPAFGPLPEERPILWHVFAAERQSVLRGDIPFFTARADADALLLPGDEAVPDAFVESGFDLVRRVVGNFGEEDLRRQLAFIEGTLYAQAAREPGAERATSAAGWTDDHENRAPSVDAFVAKAVELAADIAGRAIRGQDGSAAWIAPQYLVQAERFQLRPMDEDLYGGTSGLALFLAAVDRFVEGSTYRELSLAALEPVRRALRNRPDRLADDLALGGATGLGSIVYSLVRVSSLIDEPGLVDDAQAVVSCFSDQRIAQDVNLDVMGGSAGALLGLLALHDLRPDHQRILDRARACAQHLLDTRTASAAGPRAWASFDGRLTTGFSHGAAGIAYALLRLHARDPDPRLVEAAVEAIEYEATTYSPENRNWADYWRRDEPLYVCSWCHGAPGIGLARLGGLEGLDTPRVRQDIELALDSTLSFGLQLIDHLCCGNLGRADMMLQAGLTLSRPELVDAAREHAAKALRRAEASGGFILNSLLPRGVHSPGLFQGTAGIGYELLRLAAPDQLPSVLSWE